MDITANPYANSSHADRADQAESHPISLALYAIGVACCGITVAGCGLRMWMIAFHLEPWKPLIDKAPELLSLLGLAVFATTACCVLAATCSSRHYSQEVIACQAFVTLASFSMLLRVLSEPNAFWGIDWASYALTASAGVAMTMVLWRLRGWGSDNQRAINTGHGPVLRR